MSTPRPTAAGVQRTEKKPRPVFKRSRGGCGTCRRRKKGCDERFNLQGVCERCETGGFVCEGGRLPDVDQASQPSSATTSPPSLPRDESIPIISSTSVSALPVLCPSPNAPSFCLPFLAPPHNFATSLSLSPFIIPSDTFNPFSDTAYSSALLSLFTSLPPQMPPADTSYMTKDPSLASLFQGHVPAVHSLRSWVFKELAEDEEIEGVIGPSPDLEGAVTMYAALDQEWLWHFRLEERQALQDHAFKVLAANSTTRASCLAVASVLRDRLLPAGDVATRARVRKQGDKFFNRAMQSLHQDVSFEVKLMGIMDLSLHAVETKGTAAGYSVLSIADAFIINHASHPHPPPYLPNASGSINYLLRGMAYIDALRAMSLDTRTLFNFTVHDPFPSFPVIGNIVVKGEGDVLRGVPPAFIVFIARLCGLAADEKEGRRCSADVRALGEVLEREVIAWQPTRSSQITSEDSLKDLEALGTREMWRQAILIDLRQRLYHVGSLFPSIRASVRQIITLGGGTPSTPAVPPHVDICFVSERGLPYFIAATCAVTDFERAWCRQALGQPAVFFGGRNLPLIERLWELTDVDGMPIVDWRRVLTEAGYTVLLMC